MGIAGAAETDDTKGATMSLRYRISELVKQTPLVDTHEHIWEESLRLEAKAGKAKLHAPDFGMLFCHYADSDLQVAGMPGGDFEKLLAHDVAPRDKWRLLAPWYERCRNTGYLRCVREAARALYGEDDFREDNIESISQKLKDGIQPGYYRHVLKEVANIEYAQVNNLQSPVFMETAQPDLLAQDISTVGLSTGLNVTQISKLAKREVATLKDWHGVIDWCFEKYGPRAIAVKNQSAYGRRLNYDNVKKEDAAPLFDRFVKKHDDVSDAELKAIQDHLFHYTVEKAIEYHLPVKLHTGYYAGHNHMPMERLRQNAGDLCPVILAHPNAKFVLMHINYPNQDELIAMAKHYSNVYADMCWAWIINPSAGVRFMKEFLMAAPASKLFTFGGDYLPVEVVPGHAQVARMGIAQAMAELIEEGWLGESEAATIIERIMRGNAHDIYEYDRALKNWKT
jgi:predicted TIM-barrel fold metal-dependent hydrolase